MSHGGTSELALAAEWRPSNDVLICKQLKIGCIFRFKQRSISLGRNAGFPISARLDWRHLQPRAVPIYNDQAQFSNDKD